MERRGRGGDGLHLLRRHLHLLPRSRFSSACRQPAAHGPAVLAGPGCYGVDLLDVVLDVLCGERSLGRRPSARAHPELPLPKAGASIVLAPILRSGQTPFRAEPLETRFSLPPWRISTSSEAF